MRASSQASIRIPARGRRDRRGRRSLPLAFAALLLCANEAAANMTVASSRSYARQRMCISNMRELESAALHHLECRDDKPAAPVTVADLRREGYFADGETVCPNGGVYTLSPGRDGDGAMTCPPRCSFHGTIAEAPTRPSSTGYERFQSSVFYPLLVVLLAWLYVRTMLRMILYVYREARAERALAAQPDPPARRGAPARGLAPRSGPPRALREA